MNNAIGINPKAIAMQDTFTCPKCHLPVSPNSRTCVHCGTNLAIAAVLAENALTQLFEEPTKVPLSPEILVPRLGDYLIENGMLTKVQLESALDKQNLFSSTGQYKLLGQILVAEGYLTQSELDTAITEQIVLLQDALQRSNTQLEQRVQERTKELQQALHTITKLNQLKTNFISNISHELRTPLAHMVGYLELLREGSLGEMTKDQTHAISVLIKSYDRLHTLIDDLIQFAMVSQGDILLEQIPLTTSQIIDTASTHSLALATEKEVTLIVENLTPHSYIIADHDKLCWVIEELIENGLKFSKPKGRVQVTVSDEDGLVVFQVSDTGIGISQVQIEEIFEPFHQLDGSSTRRYGGTGIGLALAKQIIEAHGSVLKVKSVIDQGSTFEFSLPKVNTE